MQKAIEKKYKTELQIFSNLILTGFDYQFMIENGTKDKKGKFVKSKYDRIYNNFRKQFNKEEKKLTKDKEKQLKEVSKLLQERHEARLRGETIQNEKWLSKLAQLQQK